MYIYMYFGVHVYTRMCLISKLGAQHDHLIIHHICTYLYGGRDYHSGHAGDHAMTYTYMYMYMYLHVYGGDDNHMLHVYIHVLFSYQTELWNLLHLYMYVA